MNTVLRTVCCEYEGYKAMQCYYMHGFNFIYKNKMKQYD